MTPYRNSIIREIRRYGHDRSLVIITVLIPVFMALGYVAMFAKGTVHNMPIAICDADNTPTSRQLVNMLSSTPTMYVERRCDQISQAQQAMARGEVDAIVHIPAGMESKILSGGGAEAAAYINGTYITKGSLILRDITTVFQAFNIGAESKMLTAKGHPQIQSYTLAYPIVLEKHILFNPFGSYSYYLLPGLMPLILIIIVIITTVYVVGSEFRYGTAPQWLETAGGSITRALVAKLAPYFTIFLCLVVFFNTILYRYMGLPFEANSLLVLALANVLLILAYMSIGIILLALTANMRFALSLGAAFAIASFSFAGLTFPHAAMYPAIVVASKIFPFTYYLDIFIEQSLRGSHLSMALDSLGYMGLFVLACVLCIPLLKRKCNNPKYFGKL